MKIKTESGTPKGYSTICPYLVVEDVEEQLAFLKNVFRAELLESVKNNEGIISHAEVRIGNCVVMMGRAKGNHSPRSAMLYIYVEDVDATYIKALENGAISLEKPGDRYYGHREAGVRDTQGNDWWIGKMTERLTSQELQQRGVVQY